MKVAGIHHLSKLAQQRKSVIVPGDSTLNKPRPAEFIMQMKAWVVLDLIELGMHIYKKEEPCHNQQ